MKKKIDNRNILAALQLHNKNQRVLFFDMHKKEIIRILPLTHDLLSSCVKILQTHKKNYSALVAIFGARRFSASRVVALLVNVCAQIWDKKKGAIMVAEDANESEISFSLSKVSLLDTVIIPQYTALPNITKRKL